MFSDSEPKISTCLKNSGRSVRERPFSSSYKKMWRLITKVAPSHGVIAIEVLFK